MGMEVPHLADTLGMKPILLLSVDFMVLSLAT